MMTTAVEKSLCRNRNKCQSIHSQQDLAAMAGTQLSGVNWLNLWIARNNGAYVHERMEWKRIAEKMT